MFGNRPITNIVSAIFQKRHYLTFANMFRVYKNVPDALNRYLLGAGAYPASVGIITPIGEIEVSIYSHHDMLTINEIFCRKDYPADQTLSAVVDIGSNIGISALYFLTRNHHVRCYLFEPDPKNLGRLHRQLKNYEGRYELTECAVANRDGLVTFGVEATGRYGGIDVIAEQSITVQCQHINSILAEITKKEPVIDIIKIDTEGVEIATVKAMDSNLIKDIRYIFIEAHPVKDRLLKEFTQRQYGAVCQLTNVRASS